jgi:hypothetical protein
MVAPRSPKKHNSLSHNNYFDGGNIIHNYVSKTLYPDYVKPISSARKREDGIDDDDVKKRRRSPRLASKSKEDVVVNTKEDVIPPPPRKRSTRNKKKVDILPIKEDVVVKKEDILPIEEVVDISKTKKSRKKSVEKPSTEAKETIIKLETGGDERDILISSVNKFMGEMKGLTCKEVKIFLEKNPNMTVDQKILFIEQNSTNHRDLRSWLMSQHWSVKELTYYFRTQQFIQLKLAEGIENAVNYFSDSADNKDPDCVEVSKILKELKEEQKTEEFRKQTWERLGYIADKVWSGLVSGLSLLYSATKYIFSLLYSYGIEIYKWIAKDPKMAKYTLISLKIMKKRLCRFVGHQMRTNNYIDINELKNKIHKYKLENNLLVSTDTDKVNLQDETTRDIFSEAAKQTMLKSLKELSEPVGIFVGGAVVTFLGLTSAPIIAGGTALGLGLAGLAKSDMFGKLSNLIGTCVTKVVSFGMEETADAAEDAIEIAIYVKNSNTCFDLLLELVDPRNCMQDMLRGYLRAEDTIQREILKQKEEDQMKKQEAEEEKRKQGKEVIVSEEDKIIRDQIAKQKEDDEKEIKRQYEEDLKKSNIFSRTWKRAYNYFSPQTKVELDEDQAIRNLLVSPTATTTTTTTTSDGKRRRKLKV